MTTDNQLVNHMLQHKCDYSGSKKEYNFGRKSSFQAPVSLLRGKKQLPLLEGSSPKCEMNSELPPQLSEHHQLHQLLPLPASCLSAVSATFLT